MILNRGDVIWINFDPQRGHEQAGRRPALVLSQALYNTLTGLVVVCPITNQSKGFVYEVPIPVGLGVSGVVLCDHVKSLDYTHRNAVPMAKLPMSVVDEVLDKLATLLT